MLSPLSGSVTLGKASASSSSMARFSTAKLRGHKSDAITVIQVVPIRLELIDKLCTQLEKRGLDIEGLYRISGDSSQIQTLCQKFNVEEVQEIDIYQVDSHTIAGALKQYLREQQVPLIPFSEYDTFIDCVANTDDEEQQLEALLKQVELLPPENKPVFHRLLSHLYDVSLKADENKMSPENLGIVFGPTLMRTQKEDIRSLSRSNYPSLVFAILIKHWPRVKEKLPKGKSSFRIFEAPPPLTEKDWELLLATAEFRIYDPDDVILSEGELNMTLFRISAGKVAIEKNSTVITTLGIGELFGEMSFLGRYSTSAQVRALELVKLQVIDCSYLSKILSLHPDLFLRFYWNLANSMAERLDQRDKSSSRQSPFLSACKTVNSRRVSIKSNHVIKVNFKDNSFKTFTISDGTTVQGLCKIIASKTKIPHPEKFKIYETSDEMEKPLPLAGDEQLVRILAIRSSATYALYYCDTVPPVQKKAQIIIKDYPNTKLQGSIGWLYISHVSISHFAKRFGIEKKKTHSYGDIDIEEYKEGFTVSFFSRRKKRSFEIEFRTKDEAREACGILIWAWQKFQRKKREGRFSADPNSLTRGDVTQLSIQNSKFTRAVAIETFESKEADHLSLRINDIVCVLDKSSEWWFGEANGHAGIFPKTCVTEILEAKATEKLMQDGYIDLNDYPSRTDWKLILMGSFSRKYKKGEAILNTGDRFQRIYHVNSGSCKIVLDDGKEVGTINVYETFGELSFLRGGGSTANVIANGDEVEISMIDAEFLARLIQRDPILGGRFFKFLASVLERRIRFRSATPLS